MANNKDFCTECRKETEYSLQKKDFVWEAKGKKHNLKITTAICSECGKEMGIPGLLDRNVKEIYEQINKVI